jgi:hypothetical protein
VASRLDVAPVEVPRDHYTRRIGHAVDYDLVVSESTDVYVGDDLVISYIAGWMPEAMTGRLTNQLDRADVCYTSWRSNGMWVQARTFGYLPRRTLRADLCHQSGLDSAEPALVSRLREVASEAAETLTAVNPEVASWQGALIEGHVLADYRMGELPFTGGIINRDSSLLYHRDTANFPGSWSAMLGLKRHVRSGSGILVIPELRLALEITDGSLTLFDGKRWWHAVSPIRYSRKTGRRYTVVFYATQQLKNCLPLAEEMKRAVSIRTLRERRRAGLIE